ncbi:MAG: hypothetical protein IH600_02215 [Bacteroidetes bacterium]|nr:hypothetical protein [Bacteroidota bacterium]
MNAMNLIFRLSFPMIILMFIATLPACDKSDSGSDPNIVSISDLLPRENEISGWARNAGSDGSWRATSASELQEQINGGSELYTNHGFIEAAMQNFSGTVNTQSGVVCEIQVYDQGSENDANAVFDDPNNIFASPVTPTNPPSSKAQIRKDLFSWTMKFVKGRYYVLVNILTSEDKGQEVLEVFANNVAGKIK